MQHCTSVAARSQLSQHDNCGFLGQQQVRRSFPRAKQGKQARNAGIDLNNSILALPILQRSLMKQFPIGGQTPAVGLALIIQSQAVVVSGRRCSGCCDHLGP